MVIVLSQVVGRLELFFFCLNNLRPWRTVSRTAILPSDITTISKQKTPISLRFSENRIPQNPRVYQKFPLGVMIPSFETRPPRNHAIDSSLSIISGRASKFLGHQFVHLQAVEKIHENHSWMGHCQIVYCYWIVYRKVNRHNKKQNGHTLRWQLDISQLWWMETPPEHSHFRSIPHGFTTPAQMFSH